MCNQIIYLPDTPELFQVLQDVNVRMIAYGGSNNNISLLVNTSDKLETLQKLQRYVFEGNFFKKIHQINEFRSIRLVNE